MAKYFSYVPKHVVIFLIIILIDIFIYLTLLILSNPVLLYELYTICFNIIIIKLCILLTESVSVFCIILSSESDFPHP
jgi:hypothetical protein